MTCSLIKKPWRVKLLNNKVLTKIFQKDDQRNFEGSKFKLFMSIGKDCSPTVIVYKGFPIGKPVKSLRAQDLTF